MCKVKFGVKILVSMLFLIFVLFGICGYMLIHNNYEISLENEITHGMEENQLYRTALELSVLKNMTQGSYMGEETLAKAAKELDFNTEGMQALLCIANYNGELLYVSDAQAESILGNPTAEFFQVDDSYKNYEIAEENGINYLKTVGKITISDDIYFLINIRDIQDMYDSIAQQWSYFRWLLVFLVISLIILISIVLIILLRPVKKLDASTDKMIAGDYSVRINKYSGDEIGNLARKFNLMAESIEKHVEEIENEGRKKEDFVANFTHELKTPMTTMIGYADMIRSKELPADMRFEAANYIVEEGIRLEKMSQKLFQLFLAQAEGIELNRISVKTLMEHVSQSVMPKITEKQMHLHTECAEGVIYGDLEMLESVFVNFIDNAIKASTEGSDIEFCCFKDDQKHMYIEVSDHGHGIPKEDLAKVSEAFYMVDKSRTRKAGGAGLGLALAGKIINLHHAQWSITSEVNVGTSVMVEFLPEAEVMKKIAAK